MTAIKFGTDGWRAIIAADYTVANVARVAQATAQWLKNSGKQKIVIGHDCRFGGQLFAETTARVMGAMGIETHLAKGFVSTPMVSLGVVQLGADLGVVITASHNPPSYNGFKLKSAAGGPSLPADIEAVEALIPDVCTLQLPSLADLQAKGLLYYTDLETAYLKQVRQGFDVAAINNSGIKVAYDAMFGAGQRVVTDLLTNAIFLHCDDNPGFHGQAPEPIHRNLTALSALIAADASVACGLATDGDADRIGMYDEDGVFVDSHHILLLLLLYKFKYKKETGKVVITFSVTDKMKRMAEKFGLPCQVTKIGFKYIAEIMAKEDVLVGGEESGGLAVKGHIPERDGVWIGMTIFEFMAKTGKTLKELIQEVYDEVGAFATDRDDLQLEESQKQLVISRCQSDFYKKFGSYTVDRKEDLDGFKFYFNDDEWVMIRPSGTEPVLRVYSQAATAADARQILDEVVAYLF